MNVKIIDSTLIVSDCQGLTSYQIDISNINQCKWPEIVKVISENRKDVKIVHRPEYGTLVIYIKDKPYIEVHQGLCRGYQTALYVRCN